MQEQAKGLSVTSLVLGIVGLVFIFIPGLTWIGILCGLVGVVLGAVAKSKGGGGMATAGLVLSIITVALCLVVIIACAACVASIGGAVGGLSTLY